ncbi:lsm11, U7 small nuclear RNA associated [Chamberlinius hualienensis]
MSELNLEAESFNAELALRSDEVVLPAPNVAALSNLAEYETMVTGKRNKIPKQSNEQQKPKTEVLATKQSHKNEKNVLTMMENCKGPLGYLNKCVKDRIMVKVWIRRAKEMRGVCKGYIEAFDHHWNLVLSDVDETCVIPTKLKTLPAVSSVLEEVNAESQSEQQSCVSNKLDTIEPINVPEAVHRKNNTKVVLHQRHAQQLFIRGDNVALISIVKS